MKFLNAIIIFVWSSWIPLYLDRKVKEHMVKMKNWVGKGAVCPLCDNECGEYIM